MYNFEKGDVLYAAWTAIVCLFLLDANASNFDLGRVPSDSKWETKMGTRTSFNSLSFNSLTGLVLSTLQTATVPATLGGLGGGLAYFGSIEADATTLIMGIEPVWIYALATIACSGGFPFFSWLYNFDLLCLLFGEPGMGYLIGPFSTSRINLSCCIA